MPTRRTLQRSDAEAVFGRVPIIDDLAEHSIDGSGLRLWRVASVGPEVVLVDLVPDADDMTTPQLVRELIQIKQAAARGGLRFSDEQHDRLSAVVTELRHRAVLD